VARAKLAALASDILELRPFLVRDHNPLKTIVEVAPGLFVAWVWIEKALGMIPVATTERELLEAWHQGRSRAMLAVAFDGSVSSGATPWLDATSLRDRDALALSVRLLETIHAKLFAIFDKIDLAAAFGRVRDDTALTDENLALAWRFVPPKADDEPGPKEECDAVAPDEEAAATPRIRTIRMNRFLNVLRDKLGCEVRQGKGSEVVVYRTGGRIARLGRHVRNRELPTGLVRGVLERVGVTFGEWFAALQ
jgi:hypothetical protein